MSALCQCSSLHSAKKGFALTFASWFQFSSSKWYLAIRLDILGQSLNANGGAKYRLSTRKNMRFCPIPFSSSQLEVLDSLLLSALGF